MFSCAAGEADGRPAVDWPSLPWDSRSWTLSLQRVQSLPARPRQHTTAQRSASQRLASGRARSRDDALPASCVSRLLAHPGPGPPRQRGTLLSARRPHPRPASRLAAISVNPPAVPDVLACMRSTQRRDGTGHHTTPHHTTSRRLPCTAPARNNCTPVTSSSPLTLTPHPHPSPAREPRHEPDRPASSCAFAKRSTPPPRPACSAADGHASHTDPGDQRGPLHIAVPAPQHPACMHGSARARKVPSGHRHASPTVGLCPVWQQTASGSRAPRHSARPIDQRAPRCRSHGSSTAPFPSLPIWFCPGDPNPLTGTIYPCALRGSPSPCPLLMLITLHPARRPIMVRRPRSTLQTRQSSVRLLH
ncbi:hypothetical protein P171DRAFT_442707 [Karstenula rhodostoma CBS 690.94]|uniref:Uncharacterized protein n=1 Tax=Karstenula rhodostoma CBS 690.94 TaxID=1392251 RepID=A0A9P4UDG1_9PLEO|nr:hypothetical protein P171DRAFT_442707 [Karstenula rhodostoma CBS 690.94]